jgi:hypothetical protein
MRKNRNINISLIEDHGEAYDVWKKHNFYKRTLIHFDAHLDMDVNRLSSITIGNFLYHAVKEQIISRIFWVVPGSSANLMKDLIFLKKELSILNRYEKNTRNNFIINPNTTIQTHVGRIPLFVCTFENIPKLFDPVLIDIDVDFFVIDRLSNNSNLEQIGKRKKWLNEETFITKIQKMFIKPEFITLAYSVHLGYTPLIYKTTGDVVAEKLGYWDSSLQKRLLAGKFFYKFRKCFEKQDIITAKKYYFKTLELNPEYRTPENNYGELFLKKKDIKNAEFEFKTMFRIDDEDVHSLIGLGIIYMLKKNYVKAKKYFLSVIKINSNTIRPYLYLAYIAFKMNNIKESNQFIVTYDKLNPNNFFSKYLQAMIFKKRNMKKLSLALFEEALNNELLTIPIGLGPIIKST